MVFYEWRHNCTGAFKRMWKCPHCDWHQIHDAWGCTVHIQRHRTIRATSSFPYLKSGQWLAPGLEKCGRRWKLNFGGTRRRMLNRPIKKRQCTLFRSDLSHPAFIKLGRKKTELDWPPPHQTPFSPMITTGFAAQFRILGHLACVQKNNLKRRCWGPTEVVPISPTTYIRRSTCT